VASTYIHSRKVVEYLAKISLKSLYQKAPHYQPLISTGAIYLVFVYLLTLTPFRFSLFYFHQFIQFKRGYRFALLGGSNWLDSVLNVIMLMPLGLVLGLVWRAFQHRKRRCVVRALRIGFLISISIELAQLFLPRSFSAVDIATNSIGAGLGAWLAFPIGTLDAQKIVTMLYERSRQFYTRIVLLYSGIALIILMLPTLINGFWNWDETFRLLLGNEPTGNRPWQGTIYRLAIFDGRLKDHEVVRWLALGRHQPTPTSAFTGLLVEYRFDAFPFRSEGPLHDQLPITPQKKTRVELSPGAGVVFSGHSLLGTSHPATALVHRLKRTHQFSIAIWLSPASTNQFGPARIVSLSKNTNQRNFTLGQSGPGLVFRVRTPLTGKNGSKVELLTSPILKANQPQLVIASYHRGEMKLYVNGQRNQRMIYDTSHYLPLLAGLSRDRFGKAAFCFMLLFPLGWLARGLASSRRWKWIISSSVPLVIMFTHSAIQMVCWQHSFDIYLLYYCGFVSGLLLIIDFIYQLFITPKYE